VKKLTSRRKDSVRRLYAPGFAVIAAEEQRGYLVTSRDSKEGRRTAR
jgi:hypothetical protein